MNTEINFDEWSKLAQENPQEFERRRREIINKFIASVPMERQKGLRDLQVMIDA